MDNRMTWRRRVNRSAASISAVTGILVVFCGVLFIDSSFPKMGVIAAGLLTMQAGVWYMANPILTSERRYTGLRDEIDAFIVHVRDFNQAVVDKSPEEEVKRLRIAMHESVEKMDRRAGQESGSGAEDAPTAETSQAT